MNTFNKRIIYSIELSALILCCLIFASYYNIKRTGIWEQSVQHSNKILAHTSQIQLFASESELQARNFMLSGDQDFIKQFDITSTKALKELNTVKELTADNTYIQPVLDSALAYVTKRIEFSRQIIELRKKQGKQRAIQFVQNGEQKSYPGKTAYYIQFIEKHENKLMDMRKSDMERAEMVMSGSMLTTVIFIIAILAMILQKFRKETAERSRLIEELTKNDQRNKRAEKLACLGTWSINIENQTIRASDEMYRIWGFDPAFKDGDIEKFMQKLHPEDAQLVRDKVENLISQNEVDTYTCRLIIHDEIKYIRNGVTVARDLENNVLSITGYVQDVTEKKIAVQEREQVIAVLTERNKALKKFTWFVSHNLRAPVANILGLARMLSTTHPDQQQVAEKILTSADCLDGMVKDMNKTLHIEE